jgi:hypothetical protein
VLVVVALVMLVLRMLVRALVEVGLVRGIGRVRVRPSVEVTHAGSAAAHEEIDERADEEESQEEQADVEASHARSVAARPDAVDAGARCRCDGPLADRFALPDDPTGWYRSGAIGTRTTARSVRVMSEETA